MLLSLLLLSSSSTLSSSLYRLLERWKTFYVGANKISTLRLCFCHVEYVLKHGGKKATERGVDLLSKVQRVMKRRFH